MNSALYLLNALALATLIGLHFMPATEQPSTAIAVEEVQARFHHPAAQRASMEALQQPHANAPQLEEHYADRAVRYVF